MSCVSQQHTPFWSPDLGVPPIWAAWVLLLWQADYCGQSGRYGWPSSWLVARPFLMWRLPAAGWRGWVMRRLKIFFASLVVFSISSFSVNGCNFGVPMGGGKLRVFLFCNIDHSWVAISNVWLELASLRWLESNNLKKIQQRYLVITEYCASLHFPDPCN